LVGHLAGRNHKKRMALYHCDVCDVRVATLINMQQHLRSKKHRVRFASLSRLLLAMLASCVGRHIITSLWVKSVGIV